MSRTVFRRRRVIMYFLLLLLFLASALQERLFFNDQYVRPHTSTDTQGVSVLQESPRALQVLEYLAIKGRAPKTGYSRSMFGDGWAIIDGCDTRNRILKVQLLDIALDSDACTVLAGVLYDPYSGIRQSFTRGKNSSSEVQIDHVVALSDAWQKGAQNIDDLKRVEFANDPLNLLAVNGDLNQEKGDSDAASWLPPHKPYRCQYIARQIAVKYKYQLWITSAEYSAMKRVLSGCPSQVLPYVS